MLLGAFADLSPLRRLDEMVQSENSSLTKRSNKMYLAIVGSYSSDVALIILGCDLQGAPSYREMVKSYKLA